MIVPKPAPSRSDRSPGRPDIRLDFPAKAAPWLKPPLERFEHQRQQRVKNPKNRYLLITPSTACHDTPGSKMFVWETVRNASLCVLGVACNPNTLRKTAGVMFADRVGAGVLHWMGGDEQQAFAYTWAAREMIHPQPLDGSQGTQVAAKCRAHHFSINEGENTYMRRLNVREAQIDEDCSQGRSCGILAIITFDLSGLGGELKRVPE